MLGKKVLVIGELNMDVLMNGISGFPVIGKEIAAQKMSLTLGSSSAIFAANLSSLGVQTSFCGMIGKDFYGRLVMEELQAKGVDSSWVVASENVQTGVTVVLNYGNDRANITHCGAMESFSVVDIPVSKFSEFHHLHISSYFLQKGLQADVVYLFKHAKKHGLTTSLDLQWDPEEQWLFPYQECLPWVDFFLPNEKEILALTGEGELKDALRTLDVFSRTIIVKQGTRGATAFENGKCYHKESFSHSLFVDAIGAGDSFNAGFIFSHLKGNSLPENLVMANLTGAINTTAAGGTGAFTNYSEFASRAKQLFNFEI